VYESHVVNPNTTIEDKEILVNELPWKRVGILIGAEYFWTVLDPKLATKLKSGFELISTRIGPCLTGIGLVKKDKDNPPNVTSGEEESDVESVAITTF